MKPEIKNMTWDQLNEMIANIQKKSHNPNSDPNQRNAVFQKVLQEPETAMNLARKIQGSLYRCQAMSAAAWHGKNPEWAMEALAAAKLNAKDGYTIVLASSWPSQVLAYLAPEKLDNVLDDLFRCLDQETYLVSRVVALEMLIQGVWSVPDCRRRVLGQLIRHGGSAKSWHAPRAMGYIALMFDEDLSGERELLIAAMPECRYKRQTVRRIAEGVHYYPRLFFKDRWDQPYEL